MSERRAGDSGFVLGYDAGYVGRWVRLILGSVVPLVTIVRQVVTQQPALDFLAATGLYLVAIFAVYLAAHYYLGERLLARVNPWVGTMILVGPPTAVLILQLGPDAFQLALGLYISVSLAFNFAMSYGGCEVMAIPSLLFRRRYVVYCPWNVVDVVDKAIAQRPTQRAEGP